MSKKNIIKINKFVNFINGTISIKSTIYIVFCSLISLLSYFYNLSVDDQLISESNYNIVLSSQAMFGLTGGLFIFSYSQDKLMSSKVDKYIIFDRLIFVFVICLLFFTKDTGVIFASGLIGILSSMCINKGVSSLQIQTYVITSLGTSFQLFFGEAIPNLLCIRFSLVLISSLYFLKYPLLKISLFSSFVQKFSFSVFFRCLSLTFITCMNIYAPLFFIGSGVIAQLFNIFNRGSLILESIINSHITQGGKIKEITNQIFSRNQKTFVFTLILFQHILIYLLYFLLSANGFLPTLSIKTIALIIFSSVITALFRLVSSRKIYKYNHIRVYEKNKLFSKISKKEGYLTFLIILILILFFKSNILLVIPIYWILINKYLKSFRYNF